MLAVAPLQPADVAEIVTAFAELGWNEPATQYEGWASRLPARAAAA